MAATTLVAPMEKKTRLYNLLKLLKLAADVQSGEAATALLLAMNLFCLLAAYYILKPVREALILGYGAEIKSYSGAVQAALLLLIIPAWGAYGSRVNRRRLITGVSLFFIGTLLLFYALTKTTLPLGVPFFLWIGIFSVMMIAQFWSFANDLYAPEEGKRLFPLVGVGSATGAIAGAKIAQFLPVDGSMLVAASILAFNLALTRRIDRRERGSPVCSPAQQQVVAPLGPEGGFQLVLRHRYLLFIGLLTMIIQMINTNGEYIMGRAFSEAARAAAEAGSTVSTKQLISSYYANFYFWQNLLVGVFQFCLVSRVIKNLGLSRALFVAPLLALAGCGLIFALPMLAAIRLAKLVENSTNYSLENTVRHGLFLPTSREAKYKAKQVVDSFFWRAGDMLSALAVFAGIRLLGVGQVAAINAALVALCLLLAFGIAREHRRLIAWLPLRATAEKPGEERPKLV